MKARAQFLIGYLVLGSVAVAAPREQEAPAVDRLAWMAGCWEGTLSGDSVYEEVWLPPRGGMLIGMSRTIRDETTVAWEQLRIEADDGDLVYHAYPSGQAPTRFAATDVTDSSVTFANPEHDFPQRVSYQFTPPDTLLARIEGVRNGETRAVEFPVQRAPCPE